MKRLVLFVLAVAVLLVPRQGRAETELVIQLTPSGGVLPKVVCLTATEAKVPPKTRHASPRTLLNATPGDVEVFTWKFQAGDPFAEPKSLDNAAIKEAFKLLHAAPDASVVFAARTECAPSVTIRTARDVLICGANVGAGPTAAGVLFLDVDFGNAPPRHINYFNAESNLISVSIAGDAAPSPLRVQAAGGHFRVLTRQVVSRTTIPVQLEPVCQVREVTIPEYTPDVNAAAQAKVRDISVHLDGWEEWADAKVDRRLKVAILSSEATTRRELKVGYKLRDGATPRGGIALAAQAADAIFAASWTEPIAPASPTLEASRISFAWQVPCEYPADTCPGVRLARAGLVAPSGGAKNPDGTCSYTLDKAAGTFALPDEVVFSATNLPNWQDRLFRSGQRLQAYLPPESRTFLVKIPWSAQADLSGDEIRYIEILGPSGSRHLLAPHPETPLVLPNTGCGHRLSYRLQGDRLFHWGTVPIDGGQVKIPLPNETASVATLGVALGVGIAASTSVTRTQPYATAELGVQLRPKRWNSDYIASFFTRPDYELVLGYVLDQQPFQPVHTEDNKADDGFATVAYNRISLSAYQLWPIATVLYLGPGIGAGFSYPTWSDEQERVGGVDWAFRPSLRLQYNIVSHLALVATGRATLTDTLHRYSAPNAFKGTPTVSTETYSWYGADLVVQGWL